MPRWSAGSSALRTFLLRRWVLNIATTINTFARSEFATSRQEDSSQRGQDLDESQAIRPCSCVHIVEKSLRLVTKVRSRFGYKVLV
jgi:hypothetical protein